MYVVLSIHPSKLVGLVAELTGEKPPAQSLFSLLSSMFSLLFSSSFGEVQIRFQSGLSTKQCVLNLAAKTISSLDTSLPVSTLVPGNPLFSDEEFRRLAVQSLGTTVMESLNGGVVPSITALVACILLSSSSQRWDRALLDTRVAWLVSMLRQYGSVCLI